MQNKKKLIPLLVLPLLMLTGCDDIMAMPKNYSDPLVVNADGSKLASGVVNNVNSVIQNAKWEDGTASTKTLDEVIKIISTSIFGSLSEATDADPITLTAAYEKAKEAVEAATFATNEIVDRFLGYHPAYWIKDDNGARKTDAKSQKREYKRIVNIYNRINDKVAKVMYGKIKDGAYNIDGKFSETKFLMSLVNSNAKVSNPYSGTGVPTYEGVTIVPEVKDVDVFSNYLHVENYNSTKNTYIKTEVIPGIYKDLLTEQYVFEQSYSDIGRSYARKVNVVSIATDDSHPLFAGELMKSFAKRYINCDNPTYTIKEAFEFLNIANRGYSVDATKWTEAKNLYTNASKEIDLSYKVLGGTIKETYYEGTSFGNLCEKVNKIKDNSKTTDSSVESEFSEGNHTIKFGFDLKKNEILKETCITDGWYTKSSGLSELPDSIRSRLFNIGVSNALDSSLVTDRFNGTEYKVPTNEKYVAKIHGHYYLIPAITERPVGDERLEDFVWYDSGTKKYYIVEIEQAVSASKLTISDTSDDNYDALYPDNDKGWNMMEEFAHDICDKLTESSTYETQSNNYWLKYASITYHDDKIYNYFKENYPDIF